MATIVTRAGKGSALTFVEADANFSNLNDDKLEFSDLSVGAEGTASGNGAIAYNSGTGVFTYTPPTPAGIGALASLSDDNSPSLAGDLDVGTRTIYTNHTDGDITIVADGTGNINLNSGVNVAYFQSHAEMVSVSATTTGTWAPDSADGPIQYVAMTGNMTINGFSNAVGGQTITFIFDGTGGSYTLTLGASILKPGGTLALTDGGFDIVTITCADDEAPLYLATAVNDFQ